MNVVWGDELGETTKGLDILGVRALDQSLEARLVNGITTISLRGRYFTILPWLIGEFFEAEGKAGATIYLEEKLRSFVGRVEYLTLACTVLDDADGDGGGALGSVIFRDEMAALASGAVIPFPSDRSGSMLGTYFGPCRALGLLRTAPSGAGHPFSLTPRGQKIWQVRSDATEDPALKQLLWESDSLSPEQARSAAPQFSLKRLERASAEAVCLRDALHTPWAAAGAGAASVAENYDRFSATLAWLRSGAQPGLPRADILLAENYALIANGQSASGGVTTAWAEYEWRRRLHYALELLLSALCLTLSELREATMGDIVSDWLECVDLPPVLSKAWPEAAAAWARSGAQAAASVPADMFLNEVPPSALADTSAHARGMAGFALIAALAAQSSGLRKSGDFAHRGGVAMTLNAFDAPVPGGARPLS